MISEGRPDEAFVWIWLPGKTAPVVAGRLARDGARLTFNYGRSYLERPDALSIYEPELPLRTGAIQPLPGLALASCLRDAAPDAWGRRVILNRRFGRRQGPGDTTDLDDLSWFLESGSDRMGALDFQRASDIYVPRGDGAPRLEELLSVADQVEQGVPVSPDLDVALFHGTHLGGARPKANIEDGNAKLIAKFPLQADVFNVVKGEFVAMRLAAHAGLNVAPVRLVSAAGKDVLLVERFDRIQAGDGWHRKPMVSALTLLGLDEMMARYASYETLAQIICHRFTDPGETLAELFARLVFNILCGNTDDHARNHAAFWDGKALSLTPAYDICPQGRSGGEAGQAMRIKGESNLSRLALCLEAAPQFHLEPATALHLIEAQVMAISDHWAAVCEEAALSQVERAFLWRRQILNPFAFEGAPTSLVRLASGA